MRVRDVMTSNVVTVRPEASLKDVARLLIERRISGLPVVDEDGTVLGVVSEGDILFKERGPAARKRKLSWLLDANGSEEREPWLSSPRAERRLSSVELLSAVAVVLAGHDQGGVPGTRDDPGRI